ncbi:MAG TPA: glycosyltransferase [Pirellulales bacterium]|jgi:tetratricopeptide (TPR) repeat protein|nr:glycosyltransferase [Pirellulales bacterium]
MSVTKHSNNPRLSVAMIARDAEHLIAASLDSVREMADEIIVADTGSIDRTRHVALARATHVVTIPWIDDFSAARNACLDRAKGDWVLWLDAGETIDAATADEIRRFVDEDADPSQAYLILVQLPPAQDNLAGEQVARIRLMPNKKEIRFRGRVRENLRGALGALGMSIEPTSWCIHRTAADHDPAIKSRKARRDLKLAELEIRDRGPAASPLIASGEAWTNLGESRQAIDCFQQALALSGRGSTEMLEAYYGMLATLEPFREPPAERGTVSFCSEDSTKGDSPRRFSQPQDHDLQIKTCLEALEIFPFDAQLLCAIASYMQNRGRIDLANRAYQSAVTHGQINLETWHLTSLHEVAASCLSLSLELLNQDDDARHVLEEALSAGGDAVRLRRRLIDLHIKHDRRKEALEQVGLLPGQSGQLDVLRTAVRGACLAGKKEWNSARTFLQTAYDAGCRDLVCLRWLAVTLIACDQPSAAEPILRQWQAAAPGNLEAQKYVESLSVQSSATSGSSRVAPLAPADTERRLRGDVPTSPALGLFPPHSGGFSTVGINATSGK